MDILVETPLIHCKVYEDNNACISMAHGTKFSPRTKHIALNSIIIFAQQYRIIRLEYCQFILMGYFH